MDPALPARLTEQENLRFIGGTSEWRWNRWYNRTRIGRFMTSLASRGLASLRMRREVLRNHRENPYDVIYQFSNIESLGMPARLRGEVPLVIHPETHIAGELRFLVKERRLALRCQPLHTLLIAAATMAVRSVVQRRRIRRARLLICISSVFRDHMLHDYGFPRERTIVIPNPIRMQRFAGADLARGLGHPPTVLVLGRVSARKGVEDVVAVAHRLLERGIPARVRVMGGASLWSDYRKLLEDLPSENSEFVGRFPPTEVPAELASADILLQASRYEPFGLTVAEALASGVPIVGTSEVGAIEGVDRGVVVEVAPGDVEGMVAGIETMIGRLGAEPAPVRAQAHAEAARLFAADRVCEQISAALETFLGAAPAIGRRADS